MSTETKATVAKEAKEDKGYTAMSYAIAGLVGIVGAVGGAVTRIHSLFYDSTKNGFQNWAETTLAKNHEKIVTDALMPATPGHYIKTALAEKKDYQQHYYKFLEERGIPSVNMFKRWTVGTWERSKDLGFVNSRSEVLLTAALTGAIAAGATLTFLSTRHANEKINDLKKQIDEKAAGLETRL